MPWFKGWTISGPLCDRHAGEPHSLHVLLMDSRALEVRGNACHTGGLVTVAA